MAISTTAAIIGSAVLGAAGTISSVNQQKKAAAQTKAQLEKQEAAAKEAAALDESRTDTGADIRLGRLDDTRGGSTTGAGAGASTTRAGAVGSRVGGVNYKGIAGGLRKRASKAIGL